MVAAQPDQVEGMFVGMNDSTQIDTPNDDDAQIAEYVLGVLDQATHAEMAKRIAASPDMQARVAFWQSHFSGLDGQFNAVQAPSATFSKIENRLFGTSDAQHAKVGFWDNLNLWRALAAGGLAVALVAIGFSVLQPLSGNNQVGTSQLVATLEAADSDVKFLARYDSTDGKIHLAALSGEAVPDRDFELWFIQGEDTPISLGIVPASGKIQVPLTDQMRATISQGTVFAITLEPIGGGPGGKPSGPIIAAGAVNFV